MEMYYKGDWAEARERFKAWWDRELIDRPLIQVKAPRSGYERGYEAWDCWGFARNPSDPKAAIRGFEGWCAKTFFGGEAYPNLWINLGSGILASYLGANPRWRADSETVWFETPMDWGLLRRLPFKPYGEWWLLTKWITSMAVEEGSGKFFVGITDLGGVTDVAASLRGPKTSS